MFITMNAFVGFIIAYLALGSNGLPRPLIIGGEDALISLYPYQASLRYNDEHFCNGAIVNKNYIITAAQCVYGNDNPYEYSVSVGSDRLDKPGVVYHVIDTIIHSGYNKAQHIHDIALIRVQQDIQFNVNTQPISLPDDERDYKDYPFIVTGWGNNNLSFFPYPLKEILVQGYSQSLCKTKYDFIQETQLCTKCVEYGQGLCNGDFGDPVVANGVLIGIVSHVRCDFLYPDISTKIFHHRSWIDRNIAK